MTLTVLRYLRFGLHVLFVFLLVLGAVLSSSIIGPLILGIVYLTGIALEDKLPRWAKPWLVITLAIWGYLVWLSPNFVWLLFPLVFVCLAVWPWTLLPAWAIGTLLPWFLHTEAIAALIGPTIGVASATVVYWGYRGLVKEAEELSAARAEASRLAERHRLSREIHDTLAQGFNSVLLLSRAAQRSADPSSFLGTIEEVAAENLAEARRLVSGTRVGLSDGLTTLAASVTRSERALGHHLRVEVDSEGEVPEKIGQELLRVAQEGLNNVVKHASASRVRVSVVAFDDEVTLDIRDDGVGFDPASVSGFGLEGIRHRIAELGGEVTVDSSSSGTAIAVRVPFGGS